MRATVSFLLGLLLITTPVTYVLAQAEQQQDAAAHPQSVAVAGRVAADAARVDRAIIGVPQLDPNSPAALLLAPAAPDLDPADSLPPLAPTAAAISTAGKVAIVVGAVVVAFGILVLIACTTEGCG